MTRSDHIGERIRLLRLQKGLSQEQLALNAHMNTSYLGQLERGSKNPTLPTLEKIARGLEINVEALIAGHFQKTELASKQHSFLTLLTRDEIKQLIVEAINENCKQAMQYKGK